MITRRTVLGAGVTLTAMACTAGLVTNVRSARHRRARSIDALFVDETIEMPARVTAFIEASRRTLPVIGIRLDAAAHAGLLRVLDQSRAVAGISCGATLFCLERIAWDRGLRLARRSERSTADLGDAAHRQDVAAFFGVASGSLDSPPLARTYRPSRADGTLHAWTLHRAARS